MINIPFLLVRLDNEKHVDSTLFRRLFTEIVRKIDEETFINKSIPDSAGSCEKEIRARRTGIVEHAGVLARRPESRRRHGGGDMAQPFGSDQVV